jgi:serine/threonine protein kinase
MNILKLEDYFERDNAVYLVTERMETVMYKYITRSTQGYLDELTSRMLIYQVMIALRDLHKNNYVHLDVKCENILLTLLKPILSVRASKSISLQWADGHVEY